MTEAAALVGEGGQGRRRRSWAGGVVRNDERRRDMFLLDGFSISTASTTPVLWNSRRRPSALKVANGEGTGKPTANTAIGTAAADDESVGKNDRDSNPPKPSSDPTATSSVDDAPAHADADKVLSEISERRKALFQPLEPAYEGPRGLRVPAEELLPPPDFEIVSYPKGWLVGKKRKLVNVDVVESMRRIAVLEMNRKDREIDGLNEQLEEDARCLERLQLQLLDERSRRSNVERENAMLKNQVALLMDMLHEAEAAGAVDGGGDEVTHEAIEP